MANSNDYYAQISKLTAAKDFLRVIKKWDIISSNLDTTKNVPMVLPDLLWISKPGVGKTLMLKLLSEYLFSKKNLMEFCGNVRYFEFMLDYCAPDRPFEEVRRMANEISSAAGFRNVYKGIVSIDIDEWLGHCEEKYFLTFLEYLSSNSDDWLIVFNVTVDDKAEISKLESILSMFFRIEKSNLSLPDTKEFLQFIIERLAPYGLSLSEDAKNLLLETIKKLRENKYFDGYKTLAMLCQDIVYEFYSSKGEKGNVITAEHLQEFAPNGAYIERATWRVSSKHKMGFTN